ncbi:MAG: V-type ATP synthase subunit E family protein [Bullifex sp.]
MTDTALTKGILEESRIKADALLEKARSQAQSVIAEAEKKAEKVRSQETEKRNIRLEMIRDTEKRAIEGLDRVYSLRHEENAVDKVMKIVNVLVEHHVSDPVSRKALLSDLITESALAVGTPEVIISSSNETDDEMLRGCEARLLKDFGLDITLKAGTEIPHSFGVIASDPENRIIYDDTISTRIRRSSREIRHIVGEAVCMKE